LADEVVYFLDYIVVVHNDGDAADYGDGCDVDDDNDVDGGDIDVVVYDLCLGHEDLDLGAIEADDMFSSPDDNHTYLPDTTSNANNKNLDVGNDKTSKSKENFNNYLATSSSNDESGSNMSMRVSAPDEYISPKLRRRLNQLVPNPRHPRTVEYQCSCCSSTYPMTVQENPWWAVFIHECPQCKSNQVPRFDINSSTNAIELDPNIVALCDEGVDDDDDDDDDAVMRTNNDFDAGFYSKKIQIVSEVSNCCQNVATTLKSSAQMFSNGDFDTDHWFLQG
jgi:hypothetical protein